MSNFLRYKKMEENDININFSLNDINNDNWTVQRQHNFQMGD